MMKRDFHARGIATMERLNEDAVQAAWDALCQVASRFPDDRDVQLELAKGAHNALVACGRGRRWSAGLRRWWRCAF